MKPSDYEFAVGDKVVTIYGEVGHIIDICKCRKCVERGFYEPTWKIDDSSDVDWITINNAERGFDDFYQIGKYRFGHTFNKSVVRATIVEEEIELRRLKKQLEVIEELEKEGKE